jgi:molecular chaperone DnaJ
VNGDVRREWFEKDYYQTLGVAKNASAADIKKAYRKLAQQHHPDANAGNKESEDRFKEISAAYEVLGDAEKRTQYDQVRDMAASGFGGGIPGRGGGGGSGQGFPGGFEGFEGVEDLFTMFRGGRAGGGPRRSRGADLQTEVRISFDDAMRGVTVPLRIEGPAACPTCHGSGAKPGTSPRTCPVCGGSGTVAASQGLFSIARTCPECHGRGQVIEEPCPTCHGAGTVRRTREFSVKVPAGVKDGARIRLGGRGEPGSPGAPSGDLYVVVRVEAHRLFGRNDADLTLEVPVTYAEAALGAEVPLPTLNGTVTLKVPAGTPSGKTFRIRGKGAPRTKGKGHGDLLATVKVEVPGKLSKEERELLSKLKDAQTESPRKRLGVEA